MSAPQIQLPTVTFTASGAPLTVDLLDPAQGVVLPSLGPNAVLLMLIQNSGAADAYIGTDADVAAETPPFSLASQVRFLAGTEGASSPDYDIARARKEGLKFRLADGAVITITPLITPR